MGYQEKILLHNDNIKRTLFDKNVRIMGEVVNCLRITLTEDVDFPDDKVMTITSSGNMDLVIDFPGDELPLYSNSSDYSNVKNDQQNMFYLYDVLPIKCYSKFTDDLKVGDIIIYKNYTPDRVASPFIFQVTRSNGQFGRTQVWRNFIISFYSLKLTPEVKSLIDNYMLDENF
jgi:hypothetical protein